jgi:membrane associated rhomboid family serine protease
MYIHVYLYIHTCVCIYIYIYIGASGAVGAVLAWSIFSNPSQIVYLYMIVPVPAALLGTYI